MPAEPEALETRPFRGTRALLCGAVAVSAWVLLKAVLPVPRVPAPLGDMVVLAAAMVVVQATFDQIARIGIRHEPVLHDEVHTLWRWAVTYIMLILFALFVAVTLYAPDGADYNGQPYDGPAWGMAAGVAIALLAFTMIGGPRIRMTPSTLILRSSVWPATRIARQDIDSADVESRERSPWRMAGTFLRLNGVVPLLPRNFTAAGAGVVEVHVGTKRYLVAARDPDRLAALLAPLAVAPDGFVESSTGSAPGGKTGSARIDEPRYAKGP